MKGFLVMVVWVIAWGCVIFLTSSCASTFYGPDGKIAARIVGDYTYERTSAGAVKISMKHSPVIRATTNPIAAAGTAASAVLLAVP